MLASRSRESRIGKMGCSDRTPTRTSGFDAGRSPLRVGQRSIGPPSGQPRLASDASQASRSSGLGQRSRPRRRVARRSAGSRRSGSRGSPPPSTGRAAGAGASRTRATGSTASTVDTPFAENWPRDPAAEPAERRERRPARVDDGISSARSASGSQTHVPARSSAVVSTSWVSRRKSAARRDRRGVAAVGHRDPAVGHLPAGEALGSAPRGRTPPSGPTNASGVLNR